MASVSLETKRRCWRKKKENAPFIECACGCGEFLKNIDDYGRSVKYINGHNAAQYQGDERGVNAANKRWIKKNHFRIKGYKANHYRKKKLRMMEIFDNKCGNCGLDYDGTNAPIFAFHHEDTTLKENEVSKLLINASFEKALIEAEKCIMLCTHCHILHHNGRW